MSVICNSALQWIIPPLLLITTLNSVWGQFGGLSPGAGVGSPGVGCPERNGRFLVPSQCDAYVECVDGVGEQKLCPDGLLFDTKSSIFAYPCKYPTEVDCEGRSGLQPAQPTEECPHQFGYYREGDGQNCGQFRNCANGRGYLFECPEGLAFNELTLQCEWPDQVPSCNAEAYLGFTCPNSGSQNTLYNSEGFQFFRSPSNCQKYFVCINGRPRLFSCGDGQAFNELINGCDGVENVTGCSYPVDRQPQFGSSISPPRQFNSPSQNTFGTQRPQYRAQRQDEYNNDDTNIFDIFQSNIAKQPGPQKVDLYSNRLYQNDFNSKK